MQEFRIDVSLAPDGRLQVFRLSGPFTLSTVFEFQEIVRRDPVPATIIDLTGVPYIDSAALGSLLGLHVSCQRAGRRYGLVGVSPRVRSLLRMSHVDEVLAVYTTHAEAEGSFANQTGAGASQ